MTSPTDADRSCGVHLPVPGAPISDRDSHKEECDKCLALATFL